ncbi:MAG: ComEC/Rec2 family competence protein, partial [Terriglobales bacterium]
RGTQVPPPGRAGGSGLRPFASTSAAVQTARARRADGGRAGGPAPAGGDGWARALLALPAGAGVAASVHLRPLHAYHDPGVADFSAQARRQGIAFSATLDAGRWQPWPALRAPGSARLRAEAWGWLSRRLDQLAPPTRWPRANALLRGMLLGDTARLDETTRQDFQVDGVYHLLVVAGLHIGALALMLNWCFFRMLRLPRLAGRGLTLLLLAGYAWVIAGRTPTLRALLMLTVYFGALALYRGRAALNAVAVAAVVLLVWRPLDLFQPGFQMSVGAAALLAGVALPWMERTTIPWHAASRQLQDRGLDLHLPPRLAQARVEWRMMAKALAKIWTPLGWRLWPTVLGWRVRVIEAALIALVLQFGLAGFNAVYFHRFSLWAVPANIVLVLGAGMLLMLGWVGVLVGPLAHGTVTLGARALLAAAAVMARLPGAGWRVPSPPGWFLVLLGAALAAWVAASAWLGGRAAPRRSQTNASTPQPHEVGAAAAGDGRQGWDWNLDPDYNPATDRFPAPLEPAGAFARRRRILAAAGVVAALTAIMAWSPFPARLPPGLSATILDVGQGDSIFVSFPDGRTMLVDGGPSSAHWDSGEEVVAPFLWSLGLRRLDAVVLTHAHNDHLGGLSTVVADFHPQTVWVTRTLPDEPAVGHFLKVVRHSGARLQRLTAGDAYLAGATRLEVLLPAPGYQAGPVASNDDSMVLRVHWGNDAMLLEGDAQAIGERWMLAHDGTLASAVLKVGHHGSRTSSTAAFLAAVHPGVAVISAGAGNMYGLPSPAVVAGLEAAGARVFRTDRDGAVQCRLEGRELQVYLFRRLPGWG